MTKKDYEAIAREVKDALAQWPDGTSVLDVGARVATRTLTYRLCDVFAADNPRFDRARFLRACGIEE